MSTPSPEGPTDIDSAELIPEFTGVVTGHTPVEETPSRQSS
jgi:hypothetical protein